jgi:hypothetical protein
MTMTRIHAAAAFPAVLLLAIAGCEATKSSNPLSPSVAGPIPGVEITAPKLLEPGQGLKFKESQQPIKLLIENASSTGVRPISYTFEVAIDSGFATKVYARGGVPAGDGGRTSVQIDRLDLGRAYYWRARADDGANASQFSSSQFEVLPKPSLNAPGLSSPVNNERVTSRRPALTVINSDRNAAVGPLRYEFQVATDQAFGQLVAASIVAEVPGQTTFTPGGDLGTDLPHFWRARATDGDTTSSWAATQTFRTPLPVVTPPAPGPTPAPGGPCVSSNPQKIVECERAKYGHMSPDQLLAFERAVARSMNSNGISGGPFGILRKAGGANCGGFSCDIICAGQGSGQRQWDILGDSEGAQSPEWNGPKVVPNIRTDVCEIQ